MTVADDLGSIASLLPPSLLARYKAQLLWDVGSNKDVGFRFVLIGEEKHNKDDQNVQLRDFNLVGASYGAMTGLKLKQEPNQGGYKIRNHVHQQVKHDHDQGKHLQKTEILFTSSGNSSSTTSRASSRASENDSGSEESSYVTARSSNGKNKVVHTAEARIPLAPSNIPEQKPNHGDQGVEVPNLGEQGNLNYEDNVKSHQSFVNMRQLFDCKKCDQKVMRKQMGQHLRKVHGIHPKCVSCKACGIRTLAGFPHLCVPNSLFGHLRRWEARVPGPYELEEVDENISKLTSCGSCNFKTSTHPKLIRHIQLMHCKKESYFQAREDEFRDTTCNHANCGKRFKNWSDLWVHLCNQHHVISKDVVRDAALGIKERSLNQSVAKVGSPVSKENLGDKDLSDEINEDDELEVEVGDRKRTRQEEQNKKRRYDVVADGAENQSAVKEKKMEEDEVRSACSDTMRMEVKEKVIIKKKKEKKALKEAPPVCEYERIRAKNIEERKEFFRKLNLERDIDAVKI